MPVLVHDDGKPNHARAKKRPPPPPPSAAVYVVASCSELLNFTTLRAPARNSIVATQNTNLLFNFSF
jgi:hypothetical protein